MSDTPEPLRTPTIEDLERLKLAEEIAKLRAERRREELDIERIQRYIDNDRAQVGSSADSLVYSLDTTVDKRSISKAIDTVDQWSRRFPGAPITIKINSPGGSVFEGLALYDRLRALSALGHHITTVSYGLAASMGGILLQAGDTRLVAPNAWFLIHEVSTITWGNTSEIEDQIEFTRRLQDQLLEILASRSKLSKAKIAKKWKKTDWWLDAKETVSLGFADGFLGGQS